MLDGERPTFEGKYYRAKEAMANPRYRDHLPLMTGGSGEKKTIPLAAKYFDHLNIIAGFDENVRPDAIPDEFKQQAVVGGPEQVADQIRTKVLDAGVDGVILSRVTSLNGYRPGGITAVAEELKPLLSM